MFNRLKIPKAADLVIDEIKEQIAEGRLRPGMRLPPEGELAAGMGVSRPVVREALRTLEFMGIIEMKPGSRGALLLDGNIDVLSNSMTLMFDLKRLSHRDVISMRSVLEPFAAELAAGQRQQEHLQAMAEIVEGMHAGRYTGPEFSAANVRFRIIMADASGNLLLSTMMKAIGRLVFRYTELYANTEPRRKSLMESLSAVQHAIAGGDAVSARNLMQEMVDDGRRAMEEAESLMASSAAGDGRSGAR